jgi:hypothetical protein
VEKNNHLVPPENKTASSYSGEAVSFLNKIKKIAETSKKFERGQKKPGYSARPWFHSYHHNY